MIGGQGNKETVKQLEERLSNFEDLSGPQITNGKQEKYGDVKGETTVSKRKQSSTVVESVEMRR